VVVIHGGFWRNRYSLDHIGHLAQALTDAGVATWTPEYRRIGDDGGAYPGTFLDLVAAVTHLQSIAGDYQLDPDRVAVTGHSAGGHLALWLLSAGRISLWVSYEGQLTQSPILSPDQPLQLRGAVSLAGVTDLRRAWELGLSNGVVRDFLNATPDKLPERYLESSPIELLPTNARTILVHGTDDKDVPFELSERYHRAALDMGDTCSLVPLKGAGHMEVIDPKASEFATVRDAVFSLL
jgi:acetyl esterase/lipase